ncbi:MAG: 4Fe-4S binding protein [Candidatus Aminicenantes bacterium]|nr:4Fe-4S binding protein [Candidatus Aminicenantes bacterium]
MIDLLRFRVFGRLAASRSYPLIAQVIMLLGFGLVIAGGLAAPHVPAKMTGILRNTNLAALIVWSLWWPLVIISAAVVGRVWCQVCPMELVNSLVSRIGLKRKAPRFLTSGWGVAVFYSLALLGFIRTFWAHRYPERMAFFFLFLFASAMVAGAIFEKRAFCDDLCPVGRLLGLYACCAPLEWRVRDAKTCDVCRTKDCVAARHAYRLTARSCPSNLYPASIGDNRACLVCTQCRKVCPRENLRLSLRRPMADLGRLFSPAGPGVLREPSRKFRRMIRPRGVRPDSPGRP